MFRNVTLPSTLPRDIPYGSSTARGRSRAVECPEVSNLDSEYDTVPESPTADRTNDLGLRVQFLQKPVEDLLKDVRECVEWWLGKCPFHVGKGLQWREVLHDMQECLGAVKSSTTGSSVRISFFANFWSRKGVDLDDLEELAVWPCKPLWYDKKESIEFAGLLRTLDEEGSA